MIQPKLSPILFSHVAIIFQNSYLQEHFESNSRNLVYTKSKMSEAEATVNESRTTTSQDDGLQILYEQNRNIHQPWYGICIFFYSILVVIAILGNSLVLIALGRSKELKKSARNILIGLLASSDLLLSCTMPLTAIDVLTKYWPFGKDTLNMCRTVKTSSAVAVYLSSMTLIAIAVDRHHCIVNSTK